MEKDKLKYNIKDQINRLPREVKISDVLKKLSKYGIEKITFYRDQKVKATDTFSIPTDRLQIYAAFFGCTLEELINNDGAAKVKSIHHELNKSKFKSKLS